MKQQLSQGYHFQVPHLLGLLPTCVWSNLRRTQTFGVLKRGQDRLSCRMCV